MILRNKFILFLINIYFNYAQTCYLDQELDTYSLYYDTNQKILYIEGSADILKNECSKIYYYCDNDNYYYATYVNTTNIVYTIKNNKNDNINIQIVYSNTSATVKSIFEEEKVIGLIEVFDKSLIFLDEKYNILAISYYIFDNVSNTYEYIVECNSDTGCLFENINIIMLFATALIVPVENSCDSFPIVKIIIGILVLVFIIVACMLCYKFYFSKKERCNYIRI